MKEPTGWICGPRLYEYDGWLFEVNSCIGPWPLRKKDGEPFKRAGKKFYAMYNKFSKLTKDEQYEFKVGGGCIPF